MDYFQLSIFKVKVEHLMSQFVYKRIQRQLKPVLRVHLWDKEKVVFKDRWPHKRGSIHMKFSLTGQEKCDLLTAWAGLTVFVQQSKWKWTYKCKYALTLAVLLALHVYLFPFCHLQVLVHCPYKHNKKYSRKC